MASEPGDKYDHGKPRPGLVLSGFARAMKEVVKVGTFGARKYTDYGFLEVPDGANRYTDAMLRHYFAEVSGERLDSESGLLHAAHLAWNALARLELMLRDCESDKKTDVMGPEAEAVARQLYFNDGWLASWEDARDSIKEPYIKRACEAIAQGAFVEDAKVG